MKKDWYQKKKWLAALILLTVLLTGCGGQQSGLEMAADMEQTAENAAPMDSIYDISVQEAAEEKGADPENVQQNRKLIKNVHMDVETDRFEDLLANVRTKAEQLGGYVEASDIYNGSYISDYRSRNASLTIRIPAAELAAFVEDVEARSNVTSKSESVEDVTLQYVDMESQKRALQTEQETLLAMLEQAETIEDVLAIQTQLSEVRYRLDSIESQLRTYDNQVDYSTIRLYISEVAVYSPTAEGSAWDRISEGFTANMHKVGRGIKNFAIEFVIALPFLAVAAVLIGILLVIVLLLTKAGERRARKLQALRDARQAAQRTDGRPVESPGSKDTAVTDQERKG